LQITADCPLWHTLKNNLVRKKQVHVSKRLRSLEESLDATFSNLPCDIQIRMVAGFAEDDCEGVWKLTRRRYEPLEPLENNNWIVI
jgi:hypothetical protein